MIQQKTITRKQHLIAVGMTMMSNPDPAFRNRMPVVQGPTADQVAAAIAGAPNIGAACNALEAAGWRSVIAGNRISVNDRVFARYIDPNGGMPGPEEAMWVVYGLGDRPPVRIVVTGNGT